LVTGVSPQQANRKGVVEADFVRQIHQQLSQPKTCSLGYNSLRFDDEVSRNLLYRNFYDPYAREWQNGNSRWDLIDLVRATRALRPDGMEWPNDENVIATFRLEALSEANGIAHQNAHEALSDVYATIGLAKCIKRAQPKLYHFFFEQRLKTKVLDLLQLGAQKPLIHVSGMYSAQQHRMTIVLPVAQHPTNSNGVIVYDLSVSPEPLLNLTAEQIQQRVFTATIDLPEGEERIPLKTVHINKCPVLAPITVLREADIDRLEIDLERCFKHLEQIKKTPGLAEKVGHAFQSSSMLEESDPDLMIYSGGFFSQADKISMEKIRNAPASDLATLNVNFKDSRLAEMLFRYRSRNFPETLDNAEKLKWHHYCKDRLILGQEKGASLALSEFFDLLNEFKAKPGANTKLLDDLNHYARELMIKFDIPEQIKN